MEPISRGRSTSSRNLRHGWQYSIPTPATTIKTTTIKTTTIKTTNTLTSVLVMKEEATITSTINKAAKLTLQTKVHVLTEPASEAWSSLSGSRFQRRKSGLR
jgi:hypothetical protein